MSNLKKLVVSLELAKKLKELGCPQESEFYWAEVFLQDLGKKDYFIVDKDYQLPKSLFCFPLW